jgi:hypothetical protein
MENEMNVFLDESDFKPEALDADCGGDTPHEVPQKEKSMSTNQRFVLDENRDVMDLLNPGGQTGYCHEGSPEDEIHLRETVLWVRLGNLVGDLIINLEPEEVGSHQRDLPIWHAIWHAIRASHLNTLHPATSIQNRFDGKLKRQKNGLQEFTSLSLFRDDIECLLCDLYGDIANKALDDILRAVLVIVEEFTQFVRRDLWQEHQDAVNWDYIRGIGVPEGYGIGSTEWRRGMIAISNLGVRAREVRDNPSAFSRYTVEFAKFYEQNFKMPDEVNGTDGADENLVGESPFEECPF